MCWCRAEKSFTHRHLCEFTGLDMEMAIDRHYGEAMDVIDRLFVYMFNGLNGRCSALSPPGSCDLFNPWQHPFVGELDMSVHKTCSQFCAKLGSGGRYKTVERLTARICPLLPQGCLCSELNDCQRCDGRRA